MIGTGPADAASRPQRPGAGAVIAYGAVLSVMTAPGQTAAISVFTDPLLDALGITRTQLSLSYLVGTLTGAAVLPWIGRALDRYGVRLVLAVIGVVFGAVLMALSAVGELVGLTAGFVGIRMAGQGALGLAATTLVAVHVTRRRGLALGLTAAVGSAGISLAPVLLERLVAAHGIVAVWRLEALAVWAVVLPVAVVGLRRLPATSAAATDPGAGPQPRPASDPDLEAAESNVAISATAPVQPRWTVRAAAGTAMFWALTAALATSGMLTTAVNFHQISVLGAQGLSPTEAAANFVAQTVAALVATLLAGALADVVAPKWSVVVSMLLLAGALAAVGHIGPGFSAVLFGAALGAATGAVRGLEAAAYPRYFGTAHIGGIRGLATMFGVGSTAFGPVALSLGRDLTGSYTPTLLALAVLPVAVAGFAALAPAPQ